MRTVFVVVFSSLLAGCATPWAQVKDARTIEEARQLLGGYEPQITQYPPNAESWNFGKSECVLFVDGKLRLSKTTKTVHEYESGAARVEEQKNAVLCTPSQLSERP